MNDFTASLRVSPDSDATRKCGAYVLRAKSFRESGRPDLALQDYSLAQNLDPSQVLYTILSVSYLASRISTLIFLFGFAFYLV